MEKHKTFAKNLEAIRIYRGQSVSEFAKAAGLPKSTFQSVRANGHTSLDTAVRISDGLGLSLDSLTSDNGLAEKIDIVQQLLQAVEWFRALSSEDQEKVAAHFRGILEVLGK